MRRVRGLLVAALLALPVAHGSGTAGGQAPPPDHDELPPLVVAAQRHAEAERPERPALVAEGTTVVQRSAGEGTASITVSPDAGLVDGQTVTIRGEGWRPRLTFLALQCAEGAQLSRGCEDLTDFTDRIPTTGANGRFTVHEALDVVVDTRDGPVDCRVDACLVVVVGIAAVGFPVTGFPAGDLPSAPVAFDPAGPDPTRYTVEADPDTGLVDGDRVTVTGEGFPIEDPGFDVAQVTPCRAPVLVRSDCDQGEQQWIGIDAGGDAEGQVFARAILHLPSGEVDCRVAACALLVEPDPFFDFDGISELSEAGVAPIAFDPAGPLQPPPALTVTPSTGLVDGDALLLDGSGFDPDSGFSIAQCPAGATRFRACDTSVFYFGFTDATGEIGGWFPVRARFRDGFGRQVDCRTSSCSIVIGHGDVGRHAEAVLAFDPDGPLLAPTLDVTPSEGLRDEDEVRVTGAGWPEASILEITQCPVGGVDGFECDGDHNVFVETGVRERQVVRLARTEAEARAEATGVGIDEIFTVHTAFRGVFGDRTDCRSAPCVVEVHDFGETRRARVPISFGTGPLVVPPIAGSPSFTG